MTLDLRPDPAPHEALIRRGRKAAARGIRALFAADPHRFDRFHLRLDDLLLDYSKTAMSAEDLAALLEFATASGVETRRDLMFSGAAINTTENRAVLHVALRGASSWVAGGQRIGADIVRVLTAMEDFATGIRNGRILTARGERFTDVVNIGIGGSDLGPAMASLALAPYRDGPRLHFVSNIDGAHLADTLCDLDISRCLFIVASKTFTTVETMTNAQAARAALVAALGENAVASHFCAVSTAADRIAAFGIRPDRAFGFWDWVGGRYSIWSAIGLPLMIGIGADHFRQFLAGARAMDEHFRDAAPAQNLPIALGLVGWWHRVAQGYPARAVIPYDQRLARLPAYLQQLDMESNGKGVRQDGTPVRMPTGPLVWGEPGTNGQHAFFQLLHQGSDVIPVEFILAARAHEEGMPEHHALLMANCLAQSEALVRGRSLDEASAQLRAQGRTEDEVQSLAPHRMFPGDRPSVTLAHQKLDPFTLGRLIALYEHRVFVEAVLFDINAFDQWGVELGKELAVALLPAVEGRAKAGPLTAGLLSRVQALR